MEGKPKIIVPDKVEKKNFVDTLSDFIGKHKLVFITAAAVVAAVLIFIGVFSIVSNSIANSSARAMEQARDKITAYSGESDATKKADLEKSLLADLGAVVKKWPRTFAAQEALYSEASLYASTKDWGNCEKIALDAVSKLPNTYLAPLALELAAVAAEEQSKPDAAIETYTKLIAQYKTDTPNLPHAYFSIARLKEGKSDWKGALENYDKLVSTFPDSDWAKLAKDRQIYLKAKGYDKK
ncbi:MAG: tetratricopeptide repeat protein [Spirochaetes bacterium]|nr:tetratricopeptide repeat protein [Spirochaetota bacterium]